MVSIKSLSAVALTLLHLTSAYNKRDQAVVTVQSTDVVVTTVTPTVFKTVTVTGNADDATSAAATSAAAAVTLASSSAAPVAAVSSVQAVAVSSVGTTLATQVSSSSSAAAASSSSASSSGSYSGDGTYYDVGLGACGDTNTDTELVVAISSELYDQTRTGANKPSSLCGKYANVSYGGKSVKVKIVDRCPGCAYGSLDFSPSAFTQIASQDLGRIHDIQWSLA